MITLQQFNQLTTAQALALLAPCVALPQWATNLVEGRPYASWDGLLAASHQASVGWQEQDLLSALQAHPRIGERPTVQGAEAALSRQEQSAVDIQDIAVVDALREGNARYEAVFGRVFLIRAKGRSAKEILQILHRRLANSEKEELCESIEQLRQITQLRLEGIITR